MYATAVFEFQQNENGWLMSGFAFMRAAFLIFLFPSIIRHGRKWYLSRSWQFNERKSEEAVASKMRIAPEEMEAPIASLAEEEPLVPEVDKEDEGTAFDLFFLRISLVLDGALTMGAAFATKGWHLYLGKP
jgi:hypothetical protein